MNELTLGGKDYNPQVKVKAFPYSMERLAVLPHFNHIYVGDCLLVAGVPALFSCSCSCLWMVGEKVSIVVLALVSHCTVMGKLSFPFIPVRNFFIVRVLSVEGSLFCTVMDISGSRIVSLYCF